MKPSDYVKFCPVCNETKQNTTLFFNNEKFKEFTKGYFYLSEPKNPNDNLCPCCKEGKLVESILTFEEFEIIDKASNSDRKFLEAMIKLKQDDIIEYQNRINQFRIQVQRQTQFQPAEQKSNVPHCPTCNSTNINKISGLSKAGSVAMWGLFSRKVHKQWHCNNCGSEW